MATRPKNSEASTLELYRVALENAENQPAIAAAMAELGYDSAAIAEGKTLLAETRAAFDFNKIEDDETSSAYADFSDKKAELEKTFKLHRKKAKVIFRNDSLTADKLGISGELPRTYVKWLETVRKFYSIATTDTEIQGKLARLAITTEQLNNANALYTSLKSARVEYLREKGESQDATKTKDAAFAKMDDWMRDFYAVARIALEENPQLLEALGILVRG